MSEKAPNKVTSKRKLPPTSASASDSHTADSSKRPRCSRSYSAEGHAATASIEPSPSDRIPNTDIYEILFGAKDEDSDPVKSDEGAHDRRLGLLSGREQQTDLKHDSEEDEWETEEEQEEEEELE